MHPDISPEVIVVIGNFPAGDAVGLRRHDRGVTRPRWAHRRGSVMRKPWNVLFVLGSAAALAMAGGPLAAQATADRSVNVTSTSPAFPFSQNKQNEPTIAVDANNNKIVVAGSNDEIDEQACSSQFPSAPCPFTPGVGVSGVYFSFDSGKSWTQPTYSGYTARGCTANFTTPVSACAQTEGPIGT